MLDGQESSRKVLVRSADACGPPCIFSPSGHRALAKKPNYDFEKRKKEQERAKKKEAKRADRLARRQAGGASEGDPDLEGIVMGPQNGEPTDEEPAQ